jgi:hypothetical protein
MMLKRIMWLVILSSLLPLGARAADFGYTYAEGAYLSENPSDASSDLTGVLVDGSYKLQPDWRITGQVSNASCCGVSDNRYGAGVGYYTGINDKLDFIADLSFLGDHFTNAGNHNGWGLDGGVRALIVPQFELDGLVQHSDVNSTTENTLMVKALYALTQQWHLFAAYSNNSDEDDFQIGMRYVF